MPVILRISESTLISTFYIRGQVYYYILIIFITLYI